MVPSFEKQTTRSCATNALGYAYRLGTVRNYMPKRLPGRPREDQRSTTFLTKPRQGDCRLRLLRSGHGDLPIHLVTHINLQFPVACHGDRRRARGAMDVSPLVQCGEAIIVIIAPSLVASASLHPCKQCRFLAPEAKKRAVLGQFPPHKYVQSSGGGPRYLENGKLIIGVNV